MPPPSRSQIRLGVRGLGLMSWSFLLLPWGSAPEAAVALSRWCRELWLQERNLLEGYWQISWGLRIGRADLRRIWGPERQGLSFSLLFLFTCTLPLSGSARDLLFASLFLCPHFLASLSSLYHMSNKIWLFQPHSQRPPSEGPVEPISVSSKRNQLVTSAPHALWTLGGSGNQDEGKFGAVMASGVVGKGNSKKHGQHYNSAILQ